MSCRQLQLAMDGSHHLSMKFMSQNTWTLQGHFQWAGTVKFITANTERRAEMAVDKIVASTPSPAENVYVVMSQV